MFLLNDKRIVDYMKEGHLEIEDFERKNLGHTYYNFRLGSKYRIWDEKQGDWALFQLKRPKKLALTIPVKGYAMIETLERFYCSGKVLVLFGQKSSIAQMGLRLNHSPSIDPYFRGFLELGLENLLDRPVEICLGDVIGKALFFDVSDTYPIAKVKAMDKKDFERREELSDGPEAIV